MEDFRKDIHEILADLEETLVSKNKDYGNSFDDQMDEWGLVAGCIRISDKLKRLKQLSVNGYEQQVNDEALLDTIKDGAGYFTLLYRWVQNNQQSKS